MDQPFQPASNGTLVQANATTTAGGSLPDNCAQVALYNSSATATAYWTCQVLNKASDTGPTAVLPSGATGGSFPIPPGAQIRLTVGRGPKKYATIATAADGNLLISPGEGN